MKNNTRIVAECAALVCLALSLSYLEAVIPFSLLIPLPGIKPGLANIVTILALYRYSPKSAIMISMCRIFLSALLFGTVNSFVFSLFGAVLSFASLVVTAYASKGKMSFIGISVVSAVFHNMGQMAAALIMLHSLSILYYLPTLLISSLITGTLTGVILFLLPKSIFTKRSLSR